MVRHIAKYLTRADETDRFPIQGSAIVTARRRKAPELIARCASLHKQLINFQTVVKKVEVSIGTGRIMPPSACIFHVTTFDNIQGFCSRDGSGETVDIVIPLHFLCFPPAGFPGLRARPAGKPRVA